MNLLTAFKAAFDSLVRTYSPMLVSLIVGWLAILLRIPVPDEVREFVVLAIALAFGALWYGTIRVIEIVRGRASKWLLGLGLTAAGPSYDVNSTDHAATVNPTVAPGAVDEAVRSREHDARDHLL